MSKKAKLSGYKEYIDPETGEVKLMQMTEVPAAGRKNFYILYMYNFMKILDSFGGQQSK